MGPILRINGAGRVEMELQPPIQSFENNWISFYLIIMPIGPLHVVWPKIGNSTILTYGYTDLYVNRFLKEYFT